MSSLRRLMASVPCLCMLTMAIFYAPLAFAQQDKRADLAKIFDKREVMIPVRDGVKLHTEIYTPKDAKEPLPMLLDRTPYGISAPDKGMSGQLFRYSDLYKVNSKCYTLRQTQETRRASPRARTPTTRSIGSSKTWRTITAASG